jgi:hypothetical protein
MGIVASAIESISTSLRFRSGVQKALIYLWCSATPTLVFTIRNTKSRVWYGQSRSFTASPISKRNKTMNYLLVRHKVADFSKWKAAYDAHSPARQKAGLTEKYLLRNTETKTR